MFRSLLRTPSAVLVMALGLGACEKLKSRLYPPNEAVIDQGWVRDSALVVKGPPLLLRAVRVRNQAFMIPIALLDGNGPRTLRMSKRGWGFLDIKAFASDQSVIPIQNSQGQSPVRVRERMWENAAVPLDSLVGCPNMIPVIKVAHEGAELAVMNYPLPTGMKSLSAGEVDNAISGIPQLIAPTIGIRAAQLARYSRSIHQVLRKDADPAVLVEYHDDSELTDTSTIAKRRPKHLIIVMEKGVYGYRPGWVYHTTGAPNDRPALRFLESLDVNGDGKAELFFSVTVPDGTSYTMSFKQQNDAWFETWRRPPIRCDVQ